MNSSTTKHARNRIGFVTEKNAGIGPSPGREVHTSPHDLSGWAMENTRTAQEQLQLRVEAAFHITQESGQPKGTQEAMGSFFLSGVVVMRTYTCTKANRM